MRFATRLSERGVHSAGDGVSHIGEYVRVDVEGKAYVGVAQKLLDVLRVDALPQEERGARVPEIVEAYRRGQSGALQRGLECAVEVAAQRGRTDAGREEESVILPERAVLHPFLELAPSLNYGFGSLPKGVDDYRHNDAMLLGAFPLDRSRTDNATLAYAEDPDSHGRGTHEPPYEMFARARMLVCRLMRLAFEEDADWLVETLEAEREETAAQAAYALALERGAGLRSVPPGE